MKVLARKPAPALTDPELIAQIGQGRLEALGLLFERHEALVRRYLGRLGASASDADDLVQATFLEVMRAAPRFDGSHSARSWLLGIAGMMARRHRRSLRRAAARIAAWASALRGDACPTQGPAEQVANDAALRALAAALDRLPQKKREVFVLVTLEGLSGQEAAAALDIPLKTVWTRLHHTRLALRAALTEVAP
jgi:RNA polymerase sigma-70 factor (ECF subfamily)